MAVGQKDHRWFALQVRQRKEQQVCSILSHKGIEPFCPSYISRRKWADRYKNLECPLFPGYVFCKLPTDTWVPVLTTPGVIDIVRTGRELAPVDDEEMQSLQLVMQSRLRCEPWAYLTVGQSVRIEEGPLKNVTAILVDIKKSPRVLLSLTLLRRSVLVEIDRAWVSPFPEGPYLGPLVA